VRRLMTVTLAAIFLFGVEAFPVDAQAPPNPAPTSTNSTSGALAAPLAAATQPPVAAPAAAPAPAAAIPPATTQPSVTNSQTTPAPVPPPNWLVVSITVAVVVLALFALLLVRKGLSQSSGWTLGDALSEEADLTNDQGTAIVEMRASSSRLIAFMGLVVLLSLYLGFGVFILYYFGTGQTLPKDLNDIENFMLAGLTMFAPYAVNQFRAAMEGLTSTAPAAVAAKGAASGAPAAPATAPANAGAASGEGGC